MLPFAPQFLGQARVNLGQTQGVVTARTVDTSGNPIQGAEVVVMDENGGLINDPSTGYLYKTDSNGVATIPVPSGKSVDIYIRENGNAYKTVKSAPPPGPAAVIFVIQRNMAPSSSVAPESTSAPGGTNTKPLILGGLVLAAITGGIIYFSTRP